MFIVKTNLQAGNEAHTELQTNIARKIEIHMAHT